MIQPEELVGEEWAEWYRLTPVQRWLESEKLWQTYLALGGSLDPEPDTQSPFQQLVEAHYFQNRSHANTALQNFWLRELRTPELLIAVARANPRLCQRLVPRRCLLSHALAGRATKLEQALLAEELRERRANKRHWRPLLEELEALRHPH